MKEAFIVIRPNRYFETKKALVAAGFNAMYTKEVLGRGRKMAAFSPQAGAPAQDAPGVAFIAKRLLDLYVRDEDVDRLVQAVMQVNSSGNPGDGKIFILPVDNTLRVRTGEQGEDVLV